MRLPRGKGLFVWRLDTLPTDGVVARCKDWMLDHLLLKFADGQQDHPGGGSSYHPPIQQLSAALPAGGPELWGWPFVYDNNVKAAAALHAQWFTELGFVGLVLDVENEDGNKWNAALAEDYLSTLREKLPQASIGLSSYWSPALHADMPWETLDRYVDFHMPQVYWCNRDPVATLSSCLDQFGRYNKPIIPTGLACEWADFVVTASQMLRFAEAAQLADCPAINYWYWEGMRSEHRNALAQVWTTPVAEASAGARLQPPLPNLSGRALNSTLHGRSVHRTIDVPGHNVFKGYSTWEGNGHIGVGDAVDFAAAGGEPVVAAFDGKVTRWYNDATRKEVLYLETPGATAVYAHVDRNESVPMYTSVPAGTVLGRVRSDLASPHLHWELWLDGKAVSSGTPAGLRDQIVNLTQVADSLEAVDWDGHIVECDLELTPAGVARGNVADLARAYGSTATYRKWPDGRRRVYLSRP